MDPCFYIWIHKWIYMLLMDILLDQIIMDQLLSIHQYIILSTIDFYVNSMIILSKWIR